MSEENQNYFRDMIRENMEYREANGIHRPDMINLMMEAKNGLLKHSEVNTDHIDDIGFATVHETDIGKSSTKLESKYHKALTNSLGNNLKILGLCTECGIVG